MSPAQLAVMLAAGVMLSACDKPPRERKPYIAETAKLEQTIELPGGQGMVHVLRVPAGFMESTRCVVVTSNAGGPAVSCAPKDLDIPVDDPR